MNARAQIAHALPNRRAFLRGAAGAAVALPFLESIPERSPWAASAKPVFAFFISTVSGVVRSKFFPAATGPLTQAGLAAAGKATSELAAHADNLLLLSGINWPPGSSMGDAHVDGLCAALTGKVPLPGQDATKATAGGPVGGLVHRREGASRQAPDRALRRQRQERVRGATPVVRRTGTAQSGDRQPLQPLPGADGPGDGGRRPDRPAPAAEPQERP